MSCFSIIILIIINVCLICNKKQIYMKTDDIEEKQLSPRNRVMIGSSNISVGGSPLKGSA